MSLIYLLLIFRKFIDTKSEMKLQEQKIQQAVALLILLDQGFIKLKINETQKSKIQLIRVLLTGGDCNIAITPGAWKS